MNTMEKETISHGRRQFDSQQAEKGNTTLKPLKPTGEHHGRRGEDQGPEVVPGQQQPTTTCMIEQFLNKSVFS